MTETEVYVYDWWKSDRTRSVRDDVRLGYTRGTIQNYVVHGCKATAHAASVTMLNKVTTNLSVCQIAQNVLLMRSWAFRRPEYCGKVKKGKAYIRMSANIINYVTSLPVHPLRR